MQNVTALGFILVIAIRAPDYFFTGTFVSPAVELERTSCLDQRESTGRPVFAHLIGDDPEHLARTARQLLAYRWRVSTSNGLSRPSSTVRRGGGLLDPRVNLSWVRYAALCRVFTVRCLGFDSTEHFERISAWS